METPTPTKRGPYKPHDQRSSVLVSFRVRPPVADELRALAGDGQSLHEVARWIVETAICNRKVT